MLKLKYKMHGAHSKKYIQLLSGAQIKWESA